jgi:hypothetical protein
MPSLSKRTIAFSAVKSPQITLPSDGLCSAGGLIHGRSRVLGFAVDLLYGFALRAKDSVLFLPPLRCLSRKDPPALQSPEAAGLSTAQGERSRDSTTDPTACLIFCKFGSQSPASDSCSE